MREKIKLPQTEQLSLLVEIENLQKVAESRANALETKVSWLREEPKSLKELLRASDETD